MNSKYFLYAISFSGDLEIYFHRRTWNFFGNPFSVNGKVSISYGDKGVETPF